MELFVREKKKTRDVIQKMSNSAKAALDRLLSMSTLFETDDDRLTLNVSGTHYEINLRDLINFPDTLLGDPSKRARYLVPGKNGYFFPRHSSSFESILYYYISDGVLVKPETVPAIIFYEEIRFFQLNEKLIERFYVDYLSINEDRQIQSNSRWKRLISQSFFHPPITHYNCLFDICSAVLNALAIYCLCLETMSIYRNYHHTMWMITHPTKPGNRTEGFKCSDISLRPYQYLPSFNSENAKLEIICVTWFYFELFLRTLSAPSFSHLFTDPNVVLDIISILPTILSQIFYQFYISQETEETQLFDYLTCLKLFRLFRLTRHAKCLEILMKIFYINLKDLLRLSILIIFGIFYFGLTQFVLEQIFQENEIKNIGDALWHGLTVIMTIGYSDIAEHQFLSYTFAIVGVWYGAISMAIILPSINQSYQIFQNYKNRRYRIVRTSTD